MPTMSTNPYKTAHLTTKQLELLRVIAAGNEDGTPCDLNQILENIRYHTTKDSLQFSLRILIHRGLVEKLAPEVRRGAKRRLIGVTSAGRLQARDPRQYTPREQSDIVELGGEAFSVDLDSVPDFIAPGVL